MKTSLLIAAKISPFLKIGISSIAVFTTAAVAGLPIHDPFFDLVAFIFIGSVVGGEPEPDLKMTKGEFLYLWFYRSSHLFISAATAYMIHKNSWESVSGPKPSQETVQSSSTQISTQTTREELKSGSRENA